MKLIVGQNISIEQPSTIDIDFAWRSLESNLNLSVHAFAFTNGKIADIGQVNPNKINLPDGVLRDSSERHFEVLFSALGSDVDRIAFYALLPENSDFSLQVMSHFQIRINHQQGDRIAVIDVDAFSEKHKSALLFELYKHNNSWKLAYKLQPLNTHRVQTLEQLGLQVLKKTIKKVIPTVALSESQPEYQQQYQQKSQQKSQQQSTLLASEPVLTEAEILAGINLKKGQNISLTKHFKYCASITCKLNVVPNIEDLDLNVVALNSNNTLHNVKDFLYRENTLLRGAGVKLHKDHVLINLADIPTDVNKIQLLITRRSSGKRISSADFIELDLSGTHTKQKIAKYVSETSDKNYNTMVLLDIYRQADGWSIRAVGQGFSGGLDKIGERYKFSPPKLRAIAQTPTNENEVTNAVAIDNSEDHAKHKKQQNLSYYLMGAAGVVSLFALSRFMLLPLAAILAGLGWFMYQRSSKALSSVHEEQLERLVLNIIKANNYQITPFEIATNHPVNIEQSTKVLDKLCDKGLGSTAFNEEGSIYYDFSRLKNTVDKNHW
jgi:stress response protein SCP2